VNQGCLSFTVIAIAFKKNMKNRMFLVICYCSKKNLHLSSHKYNLIDFFFYINNNSKVSYFMKC